MLENHLFEKPAPYINQPTHQQCRSTDWSQYDESFPKGVFKQTIVLLFVDISTATLTLTEKLVKKVKNLLKRLVLSVLFTGLLTVSKIRQ